MKLNKILTFILVFALMLTCVSINAIADDNVAYLDLESTETYKNSKDLNQNYTFTQTGDVTYTDTTKVKLTWTINDIEATYTSHKTWDPEKLQWTEAKEDINVTHNGASFTLTNYSSKSVIGTVSFEVESSLKDTFTSVTFDDNNGKEIDTMVNADYTIDETKKTNVPSNTITATLAFDNDKFDDLSATTSATKYGTYTVTIKKAKLTQTAPTAPDKDNVTITSNSVTLTAASAGQGDTKYGYSTTNDATKVENWQDGVEFTKLDANTTYYFFVKYEGDDDYKEAVSTGTEIKTKASVFTIINSLTNAVAAAANATTINPDGSVTLTYTPTGDYSLPTSKDDITVTGATIVSWTVQTTTTKTGDGDASGYTCKNTSAILVINNPTDDVEVTIVAGLTPQVTPSWTKDGTAGTNAVDISVTAIDDGTLSYQWEYKPGTPTSVKEWKEIENATTNSYKNTNLTGTFTFNMDISIRCKVEGKYGYTYSTIWHVSVD